MTLVLLHGFTDTPRTWDLVRPALEREHDVIAPALAGHAGGPPLPAKLDDDTLVDAAEAAIDAAGVGVADLVGNSLGGYVALRLAERGRARSVVALAPAGGWAVGDDAPRRTLAYFAEMQRVVRHAAPHADRIASTPDGRRRATAMVCERSEHLPADLVADMIRGVADCDGAGALIAHGLEHGWPLVPERIACPVRVVWGTADRVLEWPTAAARYRRDWLPHADWVELDGVGHAPQLDVPVETAQLIGGFR